MFRRVLAETGDALVSVFFPGGCRLCEHLLTRASRLPILRGVFRGISSAVGSGVLGLRLSGFARDYLDRGRDRRIAQRR